MAIAPQCPGIVVTDVGGFPSCQDDQGQPLQWAQAEVVPPFELDDIDPVTAGEMFAQGFVFIGTAFVVGKAAGVLLGVIKRA